MSRISPPVELAFVTDPAWKFRATVPVLVGELDGSSSTNVFCSPAPPVVAAAAAVAAFDLRNLRTSQKTAAQAAKNKTQTTTMTAIIHGLKDDDSLLLLLLLSVLLGPKTVLFVVLCAFSSIELFW